MTYRVRRNVSHEDCYTPPQSQLTKLRLPSAMVLLHWCRSYDVVQLLCYGGEQNQKAKCSPTGTRTRVSCVKGKYANHLHHRGLTRRQIFNYLIYVGSSYFIPTIILFIIRIKQSLNKWYRQKNKFFYCNLIFTPLEWKHEDGRSNLPPGRKVAGRGHPTYL